MTVRWSPEAAADFDSIIAYLLEQNPSTADRIARTILQRSIVARHIF